MYNFNFNVYEVNDVYNGKSAIAIKTANGKIFQKVALKKNTKYKLSVNLKLKTNNPLEISGYALLGAFDIKDNTINSDNEPTNRISIDSTLLIDLSTLSQEKFDLVSFEFNSEEYEEAIVGIFHNPRAVKNILFVDGFSLTEESSNENLLLNPYFENDNDWILESAERFTV